MTTFEAPARVYRVDLTAGRVTSEPIPQRWLERYLGGKGIGARYLFEALEPGVDPLGPANLLCLLRGPFSGQLPGETRLAAVTKSPLTGIFLDSYVGGAFAPAFVGALDDHLGILIEGAAEEPVEIVLGDSSPVIRPATDRWGLDASELAGAVGDGEVAGIGPAGEQLVRYATIATDGGDHHAGRGGAGAVMGAKRLKAVIASGEVTPDPTLASVREAYEARFERDPRGRWHRASGTLETVDAADVAGVLPTRGWTDASFEHADALGIRAVREAATGREGDGRGLPGDFDVDGTVPRGGLGIALGSNLGLETLDDALSLGRACDELGLDVIEAGSAIVWAILAAERGHIDRELAFGDPDGAAALLGEIATRSTKLGDRLADGIDRAAASLGGDDLVPTVKSMTAGSYDPRPSPAMALAFATSDRGACHRRAQPVFDERRDAEGWDDAKRATAVIEGQDRRSVLWCLIVDDVTTPAFEADLGAAYFDAVDWDLDADELRTIGERVWMLTRLFNVREGVTADDDRLPAVFTRPVEAGPTAGAVLDSAAFERLKAQYYRRRGWTETGLPGGELADRLGLGDLAHGAERRESRATDPASE